MVKEEVITDDSKGPPMYSEQCKPSMPDLVAESPAKAYCLPLHSAVLQPHSGKPTADHFAE